jgi:DNA-binding NarL/FixJ family response regulator
MEIAGLICDGLKNREIGEKLFISEYTVENHLRSIYQKMDVSNRTSLVNRITFARNEL